MTGTGDEEGGAGGRGAWGAGHPEADTSEASPSNTTGDSDRAVPRRHSLTCPTRLVPPLPHLPH